MTFEELLDQARALHRLAIEGHPWIEDLLVVGIGWATVELDRAERELGPPLCSRWDPGPRDELLGATVRHCRDDGEQLILLEPDTEGRLAAFLARFGEGIAAVYLGHIRVPAGIYPTPQPVDPLALGPRGLGPLGPARLLVGGPAWGPHIVVLEPEATA